MVKVRVRASQDPVAEGNRVAVKRGGEQLDGELAVRRITNSFRRDVTASLLSQGEARNSPGTLRFGV